uniref:Uncharacterized protein n=1 Tax=Oryza sativa subsp. japonica TaxID=39947 RepID=Q2QU95_ORYSJ|nr:hypothetical protein LOC_Os12g17020 [Oryza sativa Japonica Group]
MGTGEEATTNAGGFGRRGGDAEDDVEHATAIPEEETATSAGARATNSSRPETGRYWTPMRRPLRRASGEEEVMPEMRTASQRRGRWWRRRPVQRRGGTGGWRRSSGGNTTVAGGDAPLGVSA